MNRLFSLLALISFSIAISAQDEPLLVIGNKHFTVDEFNYIYNKNNALAQDTVSKADYLDLFVIYKLKVEEAIAQGYDTIPSFKKELEFYRNELAKPYLSDKKAEEEVVQEAYEHMRYEVEASHILINLPKAPNPKDTLKAYNRIADVKRQLDNGADFEQMVLKYSEGPSARQSNGHLGYFTAFMMVYPFEKAAFNTPIGEVSDITRTSFGYHLIKVHDKRENKGQIQVAHIMKAYPYKASETIQNQSKIAIDSIYKKLISGASFEAMVTQFSDDKQTVSNQGKLPWFASGEMVPAFSEAAFALTKDGAISKPIKTKFGWHIIKRMAVRPIKSLEECRAEITQKIKRDERAFAGIQATVKRLKEEYDYTINEKDLLKLEQLTIQYSKMGQSSFVDKLSQAQLQPSSYAGRVLTSKDFASNGITFSWPEEGLTKLDFEYAWRHFVERTLIDFEKKNLKHKYPDYKHLMNEYFDGLLIFEISQKEIWNKASNDSIGLVTFYHKNSDNYMLDEHYKGTLYYCKSKKGSKTIKKMLAKTKEGEVLELPKELSDQVQVKKGRFFKGDEPMLDNQVWDSKIKATSSDYPFLIKSGQMYEKAVQPLDDIRGQVVSDYQSELEEQWVIRLKEKYKPELKPFAL